MTEKLTASLKIILVSSQKSRQKQISDACKKLTVLAIELIDSEDVVKKIDQTINPHILIVDLATIDPQKIELVQSVLRSFPPSRVAVIALIKGSNVDVLQPLFTDGYMDYTTLPLFTDKLATRVLLAAQRLQREDQFEKMGQRDALTGLLVRQGFLDRAPSLYASARREQISVAVLMVSVDRLDGITLRFGQSASDTVLNVIADILKKRKRDTDLLCRYADHCFCLMTVNMRPSHFDTFLDDIVLSCLAPHYKAGLVTLNVATSIGGTTYLGRNLQDMMEQAETALAQSQAKGENEITLHNEIRVEPVPVRSIML